MIHYCEKCAMELPNLKLKIGRVKRVSAFNQLKLKFYHVKICDVPCECQHCTSVIPLKQLSPECLHIRQYHCHTRYDPWIFLQIIEYNIDHTKKSLHDIIIKFQNLSSFNRLKNENVLMICDHGRQNLGSDNANPLANSLPLGWYLTYNKM